MSTPVRLSELKQRHAALESQILEEDQRPRPDDSELRRLKVEKLHIKEEIERLEGHLN